MIDVYIDEYFKSTKNNLNSSINEHNDKNNLNYNAIDIAEQICLFEFGLMKRIEFSEFMNQNWAKKESDKNATNIIAYTKWFNRINNTISTIIIKSMTPEERSAQIGKFINVAWELKELGNFNGVMEVLSSLHNSSISRLKKSWCLIPNELLKKLNYLTNLMASNENFKAYRKAYNRKMKSGTALPYIGLWLTDFTFIDDGNNTFLDNNLVNVEKCSMMCSNLKDFVFGLSRQYEFEINPKIQEELRSIEFWNDQDLYRMSKLKEPKSNNANENENASRFDSKTFAKISKNLINTKKQDVIIEKLNGRDWKLILAIAKTYEFEKDHCILVEGSKSSKKFFKIKSGSVRVEKLNENGKSNVLATIKPPETFGEMSIIDDSTISASVITNELKNEIFEIDFEFLEKLFENEAGLALRFYYKIANKMAKRLLNVNEVVKKKQSNLENENKTAIENDNKSEHVHSPSTNKKPVLQHRHSSKLELTHETVIEKIFSLKDLIILKYYNEIRYKKINGHAFITTEYLLFYAKSFGRTTKKQIAIQKIYKVLEQKDEIFVFISGKKQPKSLRSKNQDEKKELFGLLSRMTERRVSVTNLNAINSNKIEHQSTNAAIISTTNEQDFAEITKLLSKQEWDLLLNGAKSKVYAIDDIILKKDEKQQKLYYVKSGRCNVIDSNTKKIISTIEADQTFGEVSFILPEIGSVFDVVAAKENTSLIIVEGYYCNSLFMLYPQFSVNFYKFICAILAHRIRMQNQK